MSRLLQISRRVVAAHGPRPTAFCLLIVGAIALAIRLAFGFRAPPFVTNDSLSYLLPGFDLARGLDFAPILKRPPLYPAFLGGVIALFGEELRVLLLVQHLLGVVTALFAFGIGRVLYGRTAGLAAGLLTALSGPLLVTEQYLMSETLFGTLLAGAFLSFLLGVRRAGVVPVPRECRSPRDGQSPRDCHPEHLPRHPERSERSHADQQYSAGQHEILRSAQDDRRSAFADKVEAQDGRAHAPDERINRADAYRDGMYHATRLGWFAVAGLLLGLAALTRPIAQLVLLLLLASLPLLLPRRRPMLARGLILLLSFAVVVLPWMARNQIVHGTFAIAGGLGEGLAVRTIRYDQQFDFRELRGVEGDRVLARARRIYRDEAGDGSAFELARRLREELGVSEARADRLMRDIALEAILRRPGYYVEGTAEMFARTFAGRPVRLRQDWTPWRNIAWEPRVAHLLPTPTPAEERAFLAAERLAALYDPAHLAPFLAILAPIGVLSGLVPSRRPALVLGILVFGLLLAGAALVGIEWRYRYPLDALLNVLTAGGLVTVWQRAASRWRRAADGGGLIRSAVVDARAPSGSAGGGVR